MAGLAAAVFLLVAQAPDLTAHMDNEGRVHCAGRIAAPDGARVKVWIFAGPVEDGRALDFRTVEIKSGAFDAPLKPANGERVPGRYTVVARLDPDRQPESVTLPETVRVSFDLRVGTSQDRRLFEETLGAEIEAALKQCQDLSARLGRDSKLDWAGELAALRDGLMRRDSIRILGWEPRLRRALEEIEAILKQKAEGGGGIDADRLDRALRQRCGWMLSKFAKVDAPDPRPALRVARRLAAALESWPDAAVRRSTARDFNRAMMQLASESPARAYEDVLKAATAGRELFLAWQQFPSRPEERKALDESLRDVEKAISAAQEPAAGPGPIPMRGSKD